MKTTKAHSTPRVQGFSLVEMLGVIAVIAVISALAVPMLARAASGAGGSKDHRNAQGLATMAANAVASGDLSIPAASDADEVIDLLIAGVEGSGVFEGTWFQVHNLAPNDRVAAVALLEFRDGTLHYAP